jgi:predicted membrane protein
MSDSTPKHSSLIPIAIAGLLMGSRVGRLIGSIACIIILIGLFAIACSISLWAIGFTLAVIFGTVLVLGFFEWLIKKAGEA